jgi:hypothetical protein
MMVIDGLGPSRYETRHARDSFWIVKRDPFGFQTIDKFDRRWVERIDFVLRT